MSTEQPSLLYIHGFNSSPESQKARQLSALMQRLGLAERLRVPALHHQPREAIAQLEEALAALGRPTLVGSSLGGYYATHLAERHGLRAVLINPAVAPHRLFDGQLGPQKNYYSGETWELTQAHVDALAELEVPPPQDPARYQVVADGRRNPGLPPCRAQLPRLRPAHRGRWRPWFPAIPCPPAGLAGVRRFSRPVMA